MPTPVRRRGLAQKAEVEWPASLRRVGKYMNAVTGCLTPRKGQGLGLNQAGPLQAQAVMMIIITGLIFLLLVAAGGLISVITEGGLSNLHLPCKTQ